MRTWQIIPLLFLMSISVETQAKDGSAVYREALPSIVTVANPELKSTGTGFAIDDGATIVTAFHVVDFARTVEIEPTEGPLKGKKLKAKVLGRDRELDLAVLKIEGGAKLPALSIASAKSLKVGESVYTIGSPLLLKGSYSEGKITGPLRVNEQFPSQSYVQTNLAFLPGNSGGPALDSHGKVVGLVVGYVAFPGAIGYALSSDDLLKTLPHLKSKGDVRRGHTGIRCKEVWESSSLDAEIASFGIPKGKAPCFVLAVEEGSAAEKAGIRKFDLLLKMNGQYLDSKTFSSEVLKLRIGSEVTFDAIVKQKNLIYRFAVEAQPLDPTKTKWNENLRPLEANEVPVVHQTTKSLQEAPFKMVVIEPTEDQCKAAKVPGKCHGLAVNQIDYGSPAGDKIPYGSVIVEVDGKRVNTQAEYYAQVGMKKSVKLKLLTPDEGTKTVSLP